MLQYAAKIKMLSVSLYCKLVTMGRYFITWLYLRVAERCGVLQSVCCFLEVFCKVSCDAKFLFK